MKLTPNFDLWIELMVLSLTRKSIKFEVNLECFHMKIYIPGKMTPPTNLRESLCLRHCQTWVCWTLQLTVCFLPPPLPMLSQVRCPLFFYWLTLYYYPHHSLEHFDLVSLGFWFNPLLHKQRFHDSAVWIDWPSSGQLQYGIK